MSGSLTPLLLTHLFLLFNLYTDATAYFGYTAFTQSNIVFRVLIYSDVLSCNKQLVCQSVSYPLCCHPGLFRLTLLCLVSQS